MSCSVRQRVLATVRRRFFCLFYLFIFPDARNTEPGEYIEYIIFRALWVSQDARVPFYLDDQVIPLPVYDRPPINIPRTGTISRKHPNKPLAWGIPSKQSCPPIHAPRNGNKMKFPNPT